MKQFIKTLLWLLALLAVFGCGLFPAASPQPVSETPSATGAPAAQQTGSSPQPLPTQEYTPLPTKDLTSLVTLDGLAEGWNQIDPGGDTTCARGGKYSFFVRKANSDKLLIYFEGGGTCYDANTCRDGGNYFDASIDPAFDADNPALKWAGVFALGDARNPFKDYNIVFINYCTGDAYMGAKVVEYQGSDGTYAVQHMGFENTRTVLDWTYENFPKPASLFMIGCSAGVVGSYIHAPFILEHYKDIPVALVGDSGGGYLDGPVAFLDNYGMRQLFPKWIPQYQEMLSGPMLPSSRLFTIPAQVYPSARFGLVDTQQDAAQSEIISRFDKSLSLAKVLQTNMADIQAAAPESRYYIAPGDHHCITMDPAFYDTTVKNVRLDDWFARMAAGQPVENITP
jgi:hypothetical protein